MKCPRCQHENRPTAKFCEDCANPLNGASPPPGSNAHLTTEVETLRRALTESLAQQTATSEILRVISSSSTNLQPVLDNIAGNAARVCGAYDAAVLLREGDAVRRVAHHGPIAITAYDVRPIRSGFVAHRAILERRPIHVHDILATEEAEFVEVRALASRNGYRTILGVPLVREGDAVGAITIRRRHVQPFTDSQIALLQTFADQAVIAIENVRLFNETKEALERQTATAEILRVISESPTNVQPVFDMIAVRATTLCDAELCVVQRVDGEQLHLAAIHGADPASVEVARTNFPMAVSTESGAGRAVRTRGVVHIADVLEDPTYALKEQARAMRFRSGLSVPMLREGQAIGVIVVMRTRPGYFTATQVELLKAFADQAVIAIENVRLFTELQEKNRALTAAHEQISEAFERQTATAVILGVISRSPTDVQPVFDAIVESAMRLCEGDQCALLGFQDGNATFLASNQKSPEGRAALLAALPRPVDRATTTGRAILDKRAVQIPDVLADPDYGLKHLTTVVGYRANIAVPMMCDDEPLGVILVGRAKPGRFSDTQVELLKTFADQAVIAIENVRLFKELQTSNRELTAALDKQTVTSDILRVISRSQTDVQPVFDAIVASAVRLLGAHEGVLTRIVGDQIEHAASTFTAGAEDPAVRGAFPRPLNAEGTHAQAIRDRAPVNIADAQTHQAFSEARRAVARARRYRSLAAVPLLRQDKAIGTIAVARREAGRFTDDEIALLQTFADQAVIAVENVRLFTELRERTAELTRSVDELTALGEVGQAISSTLDLETVLSTIVSRAVQLSGLDGGVVFEYDEAAEEFVQRVATETGGALAEARRTTRVRKGEGVLGRTAITLEPVQVPDITVPGAYQSRLRENLIESGIRAILAVPMVGEDRLIGCLAVTRNHPGEFPAETIELLRTFATQSALAIQNARLFREIEDKSRQLEVASQHKS